MERWRGRTALVTGASAGIGKCIAIQLLHHGVNVVACARRVEAVESIKNDIDSAKDGVGELMAVKCDVGIEEEILAMFSKIKESKFKGVDICINNAGVAATAPLVSAETAGWSSMLKVNVLGLSICTREALNSMKEREVDDGHIVHISSAAAYRVMPPAVFYCATKWIVRALTEGLRLELKEAKSGIRVTEICPALVKTDFAAIAVGEEMAEQMYSSSPYLLAEDVCANVIHALSAPPHVQVHDIIFHPISQPAK